LQPTLITMRLTQLDAVRICWLQAALAACTEGENTTGGWPNPKPQPTEGGEFVTGQDVRVLTNQQVKQEKSDGMSLFL
jgi:hypothetical protein